MGQPGVFCWDIFPAFKELATELTQPLFFVGSLSMGEKPLATKYKNENAIITHLVGFIACIQIDKTSPVPGARQYSRRRESTGREDTWFDCCKI